MSEFEVEMMDRRVTRHKGHIRTVEDVPLPEDDPSTHELDCTCFLCIPGA